MSKKQTKFDIEAVVGPEATIRLVAQVVATIDLLEEARAVAREKRVKYEDDPEWQRLDTEVQRLAQENRRAQIAVLEHALLLGRDIEAYEDEDEVGQAVQAAHTQTWDALNKAESARRERELVLQRVPDYRASWSLTYPVGSLLDFLDDVSRRHSTALRKKYDYERRD